MIHPTLPVEVPLLDLTHLTGKAQDTAVTHWLAQQLHTPFDLTTGPLLRVQLLKLEAELHLLACEIHHIISDGWSINIILAELSALYNAECAATEHSLPPPHHYREFIQWQTSQDQHNTLAVQEAYWLRQFANGFLIAHLPTDHPRPPHSNRRGARYSARFDARFYGEIKQLARARKATVFMLLLSAYGLLLHRLTGQEELVIGTPVAGRSFEHSANLVGYCTHFLPIRSHRATQATVADYLATLKATVLSACDHQDYPLARLLDKLSIQQAYPALNTVFNLDQPLPAPDLCALQSEFLSAPATVALVDLRLNAIETNGELWLDYDYRPDLFEMSTIKRWHHDFQTLLQEIIDN